MKILFLGGNSSKELSDWLISIGEDVLYTEDKIGIDLIKNSDDFFIVSYNYRYIISKDVLEAVNYKAINLHISYLPWNKGAHPNVWSYLEDTPKGVTIHYIDEGIDTGDIIVQKQVFINEDEETLATSYTLLHQNIISLLKNNWKLLRSFEIQPRKQSGEGSIHYKTDLDSLDPSIMNNGWDTKIKDFKNNYKNHYSL